MVHMSAQHANYIYRPEYNPAIGVCRVTINVIITITIILTVRPVKVGELTFLLFVTPDKRVVLPVNQLLVPGLRVTK